MLYTILHKSYCSMAHYIRTVFLIIFLGITTISYAGMGLQGFPELSPEDIQALERELEQAAQAIDQYVSTLSPDKQEEFHKAVEEAQKMMESMSEEELQQFFSEVLAQELAGAEQAVTSPQPTTKPTPTQPAPPIEIKPRITSTEQEAALALIDSIIQHTDAFLVKMNNVPDLTIRVKRWIASKKIQVSAAEGTWDAIKKSIETFKQALYKLKDIDSKTNQYRYIGFFTKNNTLYTALSTLESQLATYQPRITVSSFGIEVLNSSSKNAIVAILNAYSTALVAAIPELAKVFEEYAPEAKRLKEEEAKRVEQARAEAVKPRGFRQPRVAGKPEEIGYRPSPYERFDFGYPPYQPSAAPSALPAAPTPTEKAKKEKEKGGGKKGATTPTKKSKKKKEEDKKKEEEKKKKEEKTIEEQKKKITELEKEIAEKLGIPATEKPEVPGAPTKPGVPRKPGKVPSEEIIEPFKRIACPIGGAEDVNGIMELIKSNLAYINQLIQNPKLGNIEEELTSSQAPDMSFALVTLPGLERRIKRINELANKYLAAYDNSNQAKTILRTLLEPNALFKNVAPQLEAINQKLQDEEFKTSIPALKNYAYLAQEPMLEEGADTTPLENLKKSIAHPISLMSIYNEIVAINRQIGSAIPKLEEKEEEPEENEEEQEGEELEEGEDIESEEAGEESAAEEDGEQEEGKGEESAEEEQESEEKKRSSFKIKPENE